ncbi:MAG: hypothetical protein LUH07_03275, partial [Lachnospiraceae bacterium]|nr:hypothetical protein [Lachnospiraceae bacterium]
FRNVEWHMIGYMVLVEDRDNQKEKKREEETRKENEILFIKPERIRREYPIPSAFSAYTEALFQIPVEG